MRKLFIFLCAMVIVVCAHSQAPNQLNYQGVARKANGHPLDNKAITLRISIRDGSAIGPVVYQETRAAMTNAFGLFNIAIGGPGAMSVTGSVGTVNWASGDKYIQVEMDPNGGSLFLNMGTQQLLSVPFALNAAGAPPIGPAGGDLTGFYPNPTVARLRGVNVNGISPTINYVLGFNGTDWTPTSLAVHPDNYWRLSGSDLYNTNAANVGIGTNTPLHKLDVNGSLRTQGFIMPTGAGDGKFLRSDASGVGSWSSSITATSIALPYKDSASSETANIFHIIQTSPTSGTGALYGETRSSGLNAFAVGGSALNGIGVKGLSNTHYGVYGTSATSSAVFGHATSGAGYRGGVFGYSTIFGGNGTFGYATMPYGFGALGISESSTGVYGQTNSPTFAALSNDGAAVYALATSGGMGVYSNSYNGIAGRFQSLNPLNNNTLLEVVTNGTGRSGLFENTNASNGAVTLYVTTNGTGRAIVARSQMPGFVNGGVIDALTTTVGGNAIFGRGTRPGGWGMYGLSDSSAGVAGIGYRNTSVGVLGQGWQGKAAQFYIDNTYANSNNAVEISNSQSGNGLVVTVNNSARSVEVNQDGNGFGVFSNSQAGVAGRFENTNAASVSTTLEAISNGLGRAIVARSQMPGFVNGGVIDALTTTVGGNAIFGRGTRPGGWGIYGLSDSSAGVAGIGYRSTSVGVLGQGWQGKAAQFYIDNTFANSNNAVEISNTQSGNGLVVTVNNSARGVEVNQNGNGTGVLSNSDLGVAGRFENTNSSNNATTLEVVSNGTARAIYAQSNLPGPVNSGVVHALTTIYGSNAYYARATKQFGWGVASISDSSVAVGGIGYRPGSVGVRGQGWSGMAGQFIIDNSLLNTSNTVEVSNSQSGNGIVVTLNNSAKGIEVNQDGNGKGVVSNSNLGVAGRFENTNAANPATTLEVVSNGTGRAIFAQSNLPGPVNSGVIHAITTIYGSNAYYARATKQLGWGVAAISDSSVAVGGIGYRQGSVGIYGQGYSGTAGQFVIDGSFPNTSNTLEVLNTQSGNGVVVDLNNSARGIDVMQTGNGIGVYGNSSSGIAARFENTNAANATRVIDASTNSNGRVLNAQINNTSSSAAGIYSITNGFGNAVYGNSDKGHAIFGHSQNGGYGSGGVFGYNTSVGGNGLVGWATAFDDWGLLASSDISIGVYGQSTTGNAAYFRTLGSGSTLPTLYTLNHGLSNIASFNSTNPANTADAVTINRVGAGRSLWVGSSHFHNPMDFYSPAGGKSTMTVQGRSGLGLFAHANGSFHHIWGPQRVAVGAYGLADSAGSQFNYGLVGNAQGGTLENAGVAGWIGGGAEAANVNAAIYGFAFPGDAVRYAGLFGGNVHVSGILSKGGGAFKIDHPQDPENKYLVHSFVESPDMMNVYNGNVVTNAEGKVIVDLPSYFEAENIDFKYQLTVIGQFAQAIIGEEIKNNQFLILTDKPNVKVSWQVTGVRNDKFAQQNRIVPVIEKKGNEKGKYLNPELYGQPLQNGISFLRAGMPANLGTETVNTQKQQPKNEDQEAVNRSVERKSNILSEQSKSLANPEKQQLIQQKERTLISAIPEEKSKWLTSNLQNSEENAIQLKPREQKQQPADEKVRQLLTTAEVVQENEGKKSVKEKADTDLTTEKSKQLITSPESQPDEKKIEKTKIILENAGKVKQLGTDTELKPEQQSSQKTKEVPSPVEGKKLNNPDVKVPVEAVKKG